LIKQVGTPSAQQLGRSGGSAKSRSSSRQLEEEQSINVLLVSTVSAKLNTAYDACYWQQHWRTEARFALTFCMEIINNRSLAVIKYHHLTNYV